VILPFSLWSEETGEVECLEALRNFTISGLVGRKVASEAVAFVDTKMAMLVRSISRLWTMMHRKDENGVRWVIS
jgi:hypothetical protein